MIRHWYEPADFSEWLKRTFSLINIILFVAAATIVFSEFRFDWFEKLVGRYLAATNAARPETGTIWETGKSASSAHEYLNTIISRQQDTREDAAQADSFSSLAGRILPGQWVTLEKQQFKNLYLSLERTAALSIIEPSELVWLINGRQLERIFCEGITNGIKIYFIDAENRVIRQIQLSREEIERIENSEKSMPASLDESQEFEGRIYSAEDFFQAVFQLPREMVPDLIQNPEILLRQDGLLTRVGIWNEASSGYIVLGFEFAQGAQTRVVTIKGREWAVWQLSLHLKGDGR